MRKELCRKSEGYLKGIQKNIHRNSKEICKAVERESEGNLIWNTGDLKAIYRN